MRNLKRLLLLATCYSISTFHSCSNKYGEIIFSTLRTDHQFFVDGNEIFPDIYPGLGARYNPSSGGNSSVSVDYYTASGSTVFTSLEDMAADASQSGNTVVMGAPLELSSTSENNTSYSVTLNGQSTQEPYWDVTDLDDIVPTNPGSGGSSGNCDLANYNGPEFNVQIHSQCQTAYLYDCANNAQGVQAACASYYQWDDGSPSFPDCPYCP